VVLKATFLAAVLIFAAVPPAVTSEQVSVIPYGTVHEGGQSWTKYRVVHGTPTYRSDEAGLLLSRLVGRLAASATWWTRTAPDRWLVITYEAPESDAALVALKKRGVAGLETSRFASNEKLPARIGSLPHDVRNLIVEFFEFPNGALWIYVQDGRLENARPVAEALPVTEWHEPKDEPEETDERHGLDRRHPVSHGRSIRNSRGEPWHLTLQPRGDLSDSRDNERRWWIEDDKFCQHYTALTRNRERCDGVSATWAAAPDTGYDGHYKPELKRTFSYGIGADGAPTQLTLGKIAFLDYFAFACTTPDSATLMLDRISSGTVQQWTTQVFMVNQGRLECTLGRVELTPVAVITGNNGRSLEWEDVEGYTWRIVKADPTKPELKRDTRDGFLYLMTPARIVDGN